MKPSSPWTSFIKSLLMDSIFVLVGGVILALSMNIIPSSDADFHAPRAVVGIVGAVFILAGLMAMLKDATRMAGAETPTAKWLQFFVLLAMLVGFSVVFIWIGFSASGQILFGLLGILMLAGTIAFAIFKNPLRNAG
jgi:hypothetical protein